MNCPKCGAYAISGFQALSSKKKKVVCVSCKTELSVEGVWSFLLLPSMTFFFIPFFLLPERSIWLVPFALLVTIGIYCFAFFAFVKLAIMPKTSKSD
jgi:hypothetical protein